MTTGVHNHNNKWDWRKLVSAEILIFAVGSLFAGIVVYTDVQSSIAQLQESDTGQQTLNKERYQDLKKGQAEIRKLVEQILLQNQNTKP